MTAAVTFVMFFLIWAHFENIGPYVYGGMTVWRFAFIVVTICAFVRLMRASWRSNYAYAFLLLAYCKLAPFAYGVTHPLIASAVIDLSMAVAFTIGTKRWHTAAAMCFLAATFVSVLTYIGLIPDASERAYVFITLSQPDLTAIFGYGALISAGFGAGDGGSRVYNYMVRPALGIDSRRRVVHWVVSIAQTR